MEGNLPSIALAEKLGSTLLGSQRGVAGVTDQNVFIYGQESGTATSGSQRV
jgi:RimJ/RimL family protein N-acetyltransferase